MSDNNQKQNIAKTTPKKERLKAFVGDKYEDFEKNEFNLGAFFLGPAYYFYRKMYLYGFILLIIYTLFFPISLIISIICGFMTNDIYLGFAERKIKKLLSRYTKDELLDQCKKRGGTSIVILIVILLLYIGFLYIASFLIVVVPAAQREIMKSRKEGMVEIAQEYGNAIRTAWESDEIECENINSTTIEEGYYYIWFKTGGDIDGIMDEDAKTNKERLKLGNFKSPWDNTNIGGYAKVEVNKNYGYRYGRTNATYKIFIVDEKNRGIVEDIPYDRLTKNDVKTAEAILPDPEPNRNMQREVVTCTVTNYNEY